MSIINCNRSKFTRLVIIYKFDPGIFLEMTLRPDHTSDFYHMAKLVTFENGGLTIQKKLLQPIAKSISPCNIKVIILKDKAGRRRGKNRKC